MGPGILIKGALQNKFSLIIFGTTQVFIDIQPLVAILTGKGKLHGFSHSYIGSFLIAIFVTLTFKPLLDIITPLYNSCLRLSNKSIFHFGSSTSWGVAFFSACIGSFSHIALDSIMHAEMYPLYPLALGNNLLGIISTQELYRYCVYCFWGGLVIFLIVRLLHIQMAKRNAG
jgi:membrane-bound metal-dependent hydrolase YbcI (DUF457 family)